MSGENRTAIDQVREAVHSGDHEHTSRELLVWRILTPISWLLAVLTTVYYTFETPHEGKFPRHTIWKQNWAHHTPFALNAVICSVYWVVLYIVQLGYLYNLFAPPHHVATAINLAPTFTLNNLLGFGFVNLWCRSYFGWALLLVIANWFNLTITYFKFPRTPRWQHLAVLAGPLAWDFVSLYWVGAVAVHSHHVAARIVANVFIWSWLAYGGFYLFVFKDWIIGFALSILSAALGVAQFLTIIVALQWIFAFTIMAVLFILSFIIAFPDATGISYRRGQVVSPDREREPLLAGGEA